MSSCSGNIFRMIPRFWRQNYVYHVARNLSVRKLSIQTYNSRSSNFRLIYTPARSFSEVKDNSSAEVLLEEAIDEGFNGEESLDNNKSFFPDATDPHIKALASANSVTEVFELFDKIEDLQPFHVTQILATLHFLSKEYAFVHHDFRSQIEERILEFNNIILNHEQFPSLLAKLEPSIDNMQLDEAAFNLFVLRKVVPLSNPVLMKLYRRLIDNVDQLDLRCLSYFAIAMRTKLEDISVNSELLPITPRLNELLDCLTEPKDLKHVATFLLSFKMDKLEITDQMLTKFAEKFTSLVEAGKYSSVNNISFLRRVLSVVIHNRSWFNNHLEFVVLLVNQHRGNVHSIQPKHLEFLYSVVSQISYPVQLYKECFERILYLQSKGDSNKGISLTSNVRLLNMLISTKNFAIPMNDIQAKFGTLLESDPIADDIEPLYFIYVNSHLCSPKLLDKYFEKSFEAVKHDQTKLALLSEKLRRLSSKLGNFYRNKSIERKIMACLNKQQTKSVIEEHYNDKTMKEMSSDLRQAIQKKLLEYSSKANHSNTSNDKQNNTSKDEQNNISKDGQNNTSKDEQNITSKTEQNNTVKDEQNNISKVEQNNTSKDNTTKNFLLFDVIKIMRYFEMNVTYEEDCYKLFVDAFRASKEELNLLSVKSVTGSLMSMSQFVEFPEIVDAVEQFYIDNIHLTKDISVRTIGNFALVCYLRNRPLKPELVDIISQNLCYELDLLNGRKIVSVCYHLAALQAFPKFLVKEIFSSEFMTKLDSEIQTENINPNYIKILRRDLMQLNRCMVLQYPEYKVPWFNQEYCYQNINAIGALTPDTKLKTEVYESLCSAVGGWRFVKTDSYSEYFNHIHFELGLDAQGNLVNLYSDQNNVVKKIAIQAYDDRRYFRDTKKLRGESQLNNLQLSLQGWQVLNISQFSWNSSFLADSSAKKQFLQESIRAVSG